MTKIQLLNFIKQKAYLLDLELSKIKDVLEGIDESYYTQIQLEISLSSEKLSFKEVLNSIITTLTLDAKQKASKYKIEGYKESRLQELDILVSYFIALSIKNTPLWFRKRALQ